MSNVSVSQTFARNLQFTIELVLSRGYFVIQQVTLGGNMYIAFEAKCIILINAPIDPNA